MHSTANATQVLNAVTEMFNHDFGIWEFKKINTDQIKLLLMNVTSLSALLVANAWSTFSFVIVSYVLHVAKVTQPAYVSMHIVCISLMVNQYGLIFMFSGCDMTIAGRYTCPFDDTNRKVN